MNGQFSTTDMLRLNRWPMERYVSTDFGHQISKALFEFSTSVYRQMLLPIRDCLVCIHQTEEMHGHECTILSSQTTIVTRAEVDKAHNDLLQSVEDFLQELKSRQEQQRVEEEEAAKIKKLKQQQVRERGKEDYM